MSEKSDLPSLDQIIAYVRRKGWKKQPAANCCKVSVYTHDENLSLTLPTSDKFIDSAFKMRTALDQLATVDGVSRDEIIGIIQSATEGA